MIPSLTVEFDGIATFGTREKLVALDRDRIDRGPVDGNAFDRHALRDGCTFDELALLDIAATLDETAPPDGCALNKACETADGQVSYSDTLRDNSENFIRESDVHCFTVDGFKCTVDGLAIALDGCKCTLDVKVCTLKQHKCTV